MYTHLILREKMHLVAETLARPFTNIRNFSLGEKIYSDLASSIDYIKVYNHLSKHSDSCTNDKTLVDNSLIYYKSLITHKVPVEMHIWKSGGHGWGFSSENVAGKGKDKRVSDKPLLP